MTNEEAKRLYSDAVRRVENKDYAGALIVLDELDAARPNSRHVNYHRALCLVELGRVDEAEACYQLLKGRIDEESLQRLADALLAVRPSRKTGMNASDIIKKIDGVSVSATSGMDTPSGTANIFIVQSSYPVSSQECSVMGHVKQGVFHVGDLATIVSPMGDPVPTPIMRIGPAETPLNLAREGQRVMMLLRIDPSQVTAGISIVGVPRPTAAAATMVISSPSSETPQVSERPTELYVVERKIKQGLYEEAEGALLEHLEKNKHSTAAMRMLAQVYLDASPPLHDVEKALALSRTAYENAADEDPAITFVLAQALGETGDPSLGLRFMERLYGATQDLEARQSLAQKIHAYRSRYGLGDVWEFSDAYGEVIFESHESDEFIRALTKGVIPLDSRCRRNHVGNWEPIQDSLANIYPEIAALFKPEPSGWNPRLLVLIIFLAIAIGVALFMQMLFNV